MVVVAKPHGYPLSPTLSPSLTVRLKTKCHGCPDTAWLLFLLFAIGLVVLVALSVYLSKKRLNLSVLGIGVVSGGLWYCGTVYPTPTHPTLPTHVPTCGRLVSPKLLMLLVWSRLPAGLPANPEHLCSLQVRLAACPDVAVQFPVPRQLQPRAACSRVQVGAEVGFVASRNCVRGWMLFPLCAPGRKPSRGHGYTCARTLHPHAHPAPAFHPPCHSHTPPPPLPPTLSFSVTFESKWMVTEALPLILLAAVLVVMACTRVLQLMQRTVFHVLPFGALSDTSLVNVCIGVLISGSYYLYFCKRVPSDCPLFF